MSVWGKVPAGVTPPDLPLSDAREEESRWKGQRIHLYVYVRVCVSEREREGET